MSNELAVPPAQRVTGSAPTDTRSLPSTLHHSAPTFPPPPITHTLPVPHVDFCSHSGSRTAGPCSHGSRCSPRTWLDLELCSNGQASLTRVDRQRERMGRRHQLPPPCHLHLQNSCHLPSKAREGKNTSDSYACPPHPLPATTLGLSTQARTPREPQSRSRPPSTLHAL